MPEVFIKNPTTVRYTTHPHQVIKTYLRDPSIYMSTEYSLENIEKAILPKEENQPLLIKLITDETELVLYFEREDSFSNFLKEVGHLLPKENSADKKDENGKTKLENLISSLPDFLSKWHDYHFGKKIPL